VVNWTQHEKVTGSFGTSQFAPRFTLQLIGVHRIDSDILYIYIYIYIYIYVYIYIYNLLPSTSEMSGLIFLSLFFVLQFFFSPLGVTPFLPSTSGTTSLDFLLVKNPVKNLASTQPGCFFLGKHPHSPHDCTQRWASVILPPRTCVTYSYMGFLLLPLLSLA